LRPFAGDFNQRLLRRDRFLVGRLFGRPFNISRIRLSRDCIHPPGCVQLQNQRPKTA